MAFGFGVPIVLAVIVAGQVTPLWPSSFAYNDSYVVWAQGTDGSCLYVVGDIYVERSGLLKALKAEGRKDLGVEFLTDKATPAKCTRYFSKAASKAGFTHYRMRPSTKDDHKANMP